MTFDDAFEKLIGHEGGYGNHPDDPGGETKYGISKRSYPDEDIAGMTLNRAKEIYKKDYWDMCRCSDLPHPVDFIVFDAAVNSGVRRSVVFLQKAVGAVADGYFGPDTMARVRSRTSHQVAAAASGERLEYMTSLYTWPTFGRGWARRIADNLRL